MIFPMTTTFNPIERVTGALPVIDSNHGQVHAGNAFSFYDRQTLTTGLVLDYALIVPAGAYIHFQAAKVVSDGGAGLEVTLREGATLNATPGGTAIVPANRRRLGSPEASVITVLRGPTVTEAGTALSAGLYLPAGGKNNDTIGSSSGDDTEWILKPETTYLLRFTNLSGGSTIHALNAFWYEEDDA